MSVRHRHRPRRLHPARLVVVGLALLALGVVAHNALWAPLGVQEPFFAVLALVVAPVLVAYGVVFAVAGRRPLRDPAGRAPRHPTSA